MADVEPLYCAEQIKVPDALPVRSVAAALAVGISRTPAGVAQSCSQPHTHTLARATLHAPCLPRCFPPWPCAPQEIMKEWTKEVLRAQPADIYAWSAKYFAEKAAASAGAGGK